MKAIVSLIVAGMFLLFQVMPVAAQTKTFTLSATVPAASGVSVSVSRVNAVTNVFTKLPDGITALSFDPMKFDTTNNIYLPDHYFALDFGVSGGAGVPDLTVTYNEGKNPNGSSNGLGYKATATFAKEVVESDGTTTETLLTAHGPKKRLIDLKSEHVASTEISSDAFPRIYLGIWTGGTNPPADPTNGQPFSNGDKAGKYTGSLVVTAVIR